MISDRERLQYMEISVRKACLVLPAGAKPRDWPTGWDIPGPCPPGWPKVIMPLRHFFQARYDGALRVDCFDEFAEPTDALVGHMFQISAYADTDPICRMRVSGDVWSKIALVGIQPLSGGNFGICAPLEFERERLAGAPLRIVVRVFGDESGAKAEVIA